MLHYNKLAFLQPYLDRPGVVEILVNRPGEVILEIPGAGTVIEDAPSLTLNAFWALAEEIANRANIPDFQRKPKISTTINGMDRLELFLGQAADHHLAMSIRKWTPRRFTIDDYLSHPDDPPIDRRAEQALPHLPTLFAQQQHDPGKRQAFYDGLATIINSHANVAMSGGTFTGKTQLLNSILALADPHQRLISIADTIELDLSRFPNKKQFTVNRLQTDQDIGYTDIIDTCTRLRPDRIILQEISMENAYIVLRALNTGHGGFLTTVHADTPIDALHAITTNILLTKQIDPKAVFDTLAAKLDVVIQVARIPGTYLRRITDVYQREGV